MLGLHIIYLKRGLTLLTIHSLKIAQGSGYPGYTVPIPLFKSPTSITLLLNIHGPVINLIRCQIRLFDVL
jgi:hypothetical protein